MKTDIEILTTANGWIIKPVHRDSYFAGLESTYVFTEVAELTKWLKKNIREPFVEK